MSKRKIAVAIIGMAAMILMPAMRAEAGVGDSAVVAVFTGNATVDPGLCLPAGGCAGPTEASYNLVVPGDETDNVPDICTAVGVFEGEAVTGAPNTNCGLVANGTVTANLLNVGPSCGMSEGNSDAAETNTVTLNGETRNTTNGWITSAGGTIPVIGTVEGDPADHTLAALVQARPLTEDGAVACLEVPAENFIIVGVAVVA